MEHSSLKDTRPPYGSPAHEPFMQGLVAEYISAHAASRVVNTDLARQFLPGYTPANVDNERVFFGDAAEMTDRVFAQWLKEPYEDGVDTVLFLAGGTGSGKSAAAMEHLNHRNITSYAFTVDSTMVNRQYACDLIDMVLSHGFQCEILYVYRDPVDAWSNGVWKRWEEDGGHFVFPQVHLQTHINARANFINIVENFRNYVNFNMVINETGKDPQTITLNDLKNLPYIGEVVKENMDEVTRKKLRSHPSLVGRKEMFVAGRGDGNDRL